MGGASSKDKGSSFERDICKELSLWWTNGKRDDVFWRTAGSGGRATNRMKQGQQTAGACGDMTFVDAVGDPLLKLCCFEFKRGYGKWCLLDIIDRRPVKKKGKPTIIEQFWLQATQSADAAGVRFPVVIFRRDKRKSGILGPKEFLAHLSLYIGQYQGLQINTVLCGDKVFVTGLPEFLEYCTPEAVKILITKGV